MSPWCCFWTHDCDSPFGLSLTLQSFFVLVCTPWPASAFVFRCFFSPAAAGFACSILLFPLFSCDLASFRKGAQLSPLKVRVRSLPPRDALTVIASHCCLLRYLSVPSLLGTYFSAVLASVREKTSALSFTLIRLALATTLSVIFL